MNKIFILDNRSNLIELYATNLKAYVNAEIKNIVDIKNGISFLQKNNPDLIICKAFINDVDIYKKIEKCLQKKNKAIPVIILGTKNVTKANRIELKEPFEIKELIRTVADFLGITAQDMIKVVVPTYYPISLSHFINGFELPCPIYKRNKNKYSQILGPRARVHSEVIEILSNEGINEIYTDALSRLNLINSLTNYILDRLRDQSISLEERLDITSKAHKLVLNTVNELGIDGNAQELAQKSIDTMRCVVAGIPQLKELLELTSTNQLGFHFQHSLFITYVSTHIIQRMEWGNVDQQNKIAFVAFFHDITLSKEEHVRIHSDKELNAGKFSEEENKLIHTHALDAAKLCSVSNIPLGTDVIMKQHHGSRTGQGLSDLSQNISPLAIVFILAEEWTHLYIKNSEKKLPLKKKKLMKHFEKKFGVLPPFRKVFPIIQELVI